MSPILERTLAVLVLFLALIEAPLVQGWQSSSRLRCKVFYPKKRLRRSSLFRSPGRSSPLFSKISGSGVNGNTNGIENQQPQGLNRRSRIKNRISNIWSACQLRSSNVDSLPPVDEVMDELETENRLLRETIQQLEIENDRLSSQQKIILETFEGEGRLRPASTTDRDLIADQSKSATGADEFDMTNFGITLSGEELTADVTVATDADAQLWCDDLDEDSCPVEPTVSFGSALRDRAYWLVGLLIMQSCSGIILSRNEALLANHPVIIYFLTMLVGAGGNAGNQASVRVIRGIALGTLNEKTQAQFLSREFKMAAALSGILSIAGFLRAAAFRTPFPETIAVTSSLSLIVFSSICLGAVLPLMLQKLGVDPAHSSTTIQVIMDILGVFVAVAISSLILDSPLGMMLINKLGG